MSICLSLLALAAAFQQPLPQVLNTPGDSISLEFYEGLEGPVFDDAQRLYEEQRYQESAGRFMELYGATGHPVALLLAGNGFYRLNEVDRSIELYLQAMNEGLERMPDVHYNLANAYYAKYRREEAISAFRKVLELTNDTDAMAHYHLAILLDGDGAHDESIAHYRKTVELTNDGEPLARQHLGVAYFMKGDYETSARELEIYIRMIPDDPGGYLNYGMALRYVGKLDEAIEQLSRALDQSGDSLPPAHYQLALIYADQEEYALSIKHFEAAIEQGHANPKLLEEYEAVKKKRPGGQ